MKYGQTKDSFIKSETKWSKAMKRAMLKNYLKLFYNYFLRRGKASQKGAPLLKVRSNLDPRPLSPELKIKSPTRSPSVFIA